METPKTQLGYLESLAQVLALKQENLSVEHQAICQLFNQADEETFYQLAPHLFMTTDQEEPVVVSELEATPEGYRLFKELVEEKTKWS